MQYKTVSVGMLNIKFIQFNNLFKVSYQSKVFNRIFISSSAEILQRKKRKVGNMSSFNSWLIFVTLLFKIFFYQSSFAGYNSSYPPSGEFLHQVNLYQRHHNDTWPGVLLSRQAHLTS